MAYSDEVLADSPLAYWKFDETSGTTIADSSGNGRSGTYSGTPVLSEPGLFTGDTASARASSGLLGSVADGAWMDVSTGLTVETWMKANNATNVTGVFSRYSSGPGWIIWQIRGRIGFLYWDNSTQHEIDGPSLVSGRTYHVAATVSTTAMQLYVNGLLVASKAITTSIATINANGNAIQFGGYASANFSLATLSDAAVYGSVLSASRILAHYEAAATVPAFRKEISTDSPRAYWSLDDTLGSTAADIAMAATVYAPVGVYVGSPTLGATSLMSDGTGTAMTCDGVNDHVEVSDTANQLLLSGTGQYTAEAIFKTSTSTAGAIINRTSFSGSNRFQVTVEGGAVKGYNFNTSVTLTSPASTYADGVAHHVALVQDATHLRLYVDGAEVASAASVNASGSDTQITYIGRGRYIGWSGYFTGTIDGVAIYGTALSAARVEAHYDAALGVATGVDVEPGAGSATAAGYAPTVDVAAAPIGIDPGAGSATAGGHAPTVEVDAGGTTVSSLYDGTTVPPGSFFATGGDLTTAIVFRADVDGNITSLRAYVSSGNTVTNTMRLWDSTGTLQRTETFTGPGVEGWVDVPITPFAVTAGDQFAVGHHNTATYRSATNAFAFADIVSSDGNLHALAAGTFTYAGLSTNGRYATSNSATVPTLQFSSSYYGLDAALTSGSGTPPVEITPAAGSATASGYAPTVTVPGPIDVAPGAGSATAAGYVPTVVVTSVITITPDPGTATAGGYEPTVDGVTAVVDTPDTFPLRSHGDIGYLMIPPAATPPAGLDPIPVVRYSHVAPAITEANPTLTAGVDYPRPQAVEVGVAQIWVDGHPVTYLGGAPVIAKQYKRRRPVASTVATFEVPAMQKWHKAGEGDYFMLRPDAPVEMAIVKDDGTRIHLWSGFVSDDAATIGEDKRRGFTADGTLWQAGYAQHEPPHYLPPTDIGILVARALNDVPSKRWADIPETLTGILTRHRGSANQSVMEYVTELLARAWTDSGQQWTLDEVAPGEFRLILKPDTGHDWTITEGVFGIDVDLSRDQSTRVDVIYGKGVAPNGGQWRGTRFPGLILATPPEYPNTSGASMHLGDTDADTDSGDGISVWQARMVELGYSLTVDGVLNSSDIEVVRRLQRRMGALVDGVIGPQTWAASFNRGPAGIDLTQWREPIAALPWTQQYLRDPNGVILGDNPDYDPTRVVHEVEVDAGTNITWQGFQPLSERMLGIESEPGLTGRIRLWGSDPHEGWRGEVREGDRIQILGHEGEDVIVTVASVEVDETDDGLEVVLTVDERSRDAMSVDAILERNREALPDLTRRPGNPNRDSRLDRDRFVQWDIDSPCGFMPRTAVFGGLWVAPNPIPFAEVGRIVKVMLTSTVPFTLVLMALPTKPSQMAALVPDPHASDDPWTAVMDELDALGLITMWGSQGQRCGYSPGQENEGHSFTGRFEAFGGFDFVSGHPPYVWPLLFSSTTGFIGGASGEYGRFYPGTWT